jgi:hypothetical protein
MTAVIDLAAARWARQVSTCVPHLADQIHAMIRDGGSRRDVNAVIASDLRARLAERRSRTSLLKSEEQEHA